LKSRADVDPARIGLWGGSYGGYLTAMGLSRASDLFRCRRRLPRRARLEPGHQTFVPDYNVLEDPDFRARLRSVADGARRHLEVAGAADLMATTTATCRSSNRST
jgi:hypothetical protein